MGLLGPGYGPHGVVAITTGLDDTAYVGDTETMVYQLPFIAAPKRIYKVAFRVGIADADSTGDQTANRYAKQGLTATCRWAAGSSVAVSSASIGYLRTTTFDDDSLTGTGADASFYLVNPPGGQLTVGISIKAARAAATYGQVRYLTGPNAHLVVEDVGPYSE
ncbi:hypothetical protein AB0E27_31555 [Streptomyces sparsogenes]|uniref:DUF7298 domain-containing protein n=1 Tax=Streptomyces sparsogenes TaxID=67365 RepID=UPI0033E6D28C